MRTQQGPRGDVQATVAGVQDLAARVGERAGAQGQVAIAGDESAVAIVENLGGGDAAGIRFRGDELAAAIVEGLRGHVDLAGAEGGLAMVDHAQAQCRRARRGRLAARAIDATGIEHQAAGAGMGDLAVFIDQPAGVDGQTLRIAGQHAAAVVELAQDRQPVSVLPLCRTVPPRLETSCARRSNAPAASN